MLVGSVHVMLEYGVNPIELLMLVQALPPSCKMMIALFYRSE
jgi:hypothetical protein